MKGFKKGWITVLAGCMSSGKTEELMRLLRRNVIADAEYVIFKHTIDVRDGEHVKSRCAKETIPAIVVDNPYEILKSMEKPENKNKDIVAIEEVQFFSKDILNVVRMLSNKGYRIYLTGLNQDFRGEPFEVTALAMAIADKIIYLTAICKKCKSNKATRTQRFIDGKPAPYNSPIIQVGGDESYEARCIDCHEIPESPYEK